MKRDAPLFDPGIRADPDAQQRVREWIAALRSGRYRQGRNALRVRKRFCCLGVACDLADPEGWLRCNLDDPADYVWTFREASTELPKSIQSALCLRDPTGWYLPGGAKESSSLAALNDNGVPFAQIADVIERELEESLA